MSLNVDEARAMLIQQQLRPGSVLDPRVLDALATVPRERFVPSAYRGVAFAEEAIPLPCGQYMMTPLQEGLILQTLGIKRTDRIVEIGTGSGYLAACLAQLGAQVLTIELFAELADAARARLERHGIANCEVMIGDAFAVAPQRADVIAVTGSLPVDEGHFARWLNPGGRLFQVVGAAVPMRGWRLERVADQEFRRECLFETALPPLVNATAAPRFAF